MTETEIATFLGSGGTGTLAFATAADEPPHAIPVSYGYDPGSGNFHFRLSTASGGEKTTVLDRPVSFTTHDRTDEGWKSVVATGELQELSDEPYESAAVQEQWAVSIPLVDVFEHPPDDVEFRPFRLVPDDLSGRKQVGESD